MSRWLLLFSLALAPACGGERLSSVEGALVVLPQELEFPQAWVGFPTTARFEVRNTGRVGRAAELSVADPFSVPAQLEVPGAGTVALEVTFAPKQGGDVVAPLELVSDGAVQTVSLRASARVPPDCHAVGACRDSTFDLESGTCVESLLPDDSPCSLESACVEDVRCRAGECRGAQRSCDDADACTVDACESASGCLHVAVQCPPSTDPCKVAACDSSSGCGLADAPDGTLCGPADCVTADVCMAGACKTVPVPNGFTCAAPTPCQGKGACQGQQCVQPAPTPLTPVWSYPVPQDRTLYFNGLADPAGNLYWAECPSSTACELVSATRDGFIRFKVPSSANHLSSRGAGALAIVGGQLIASLGWDGIEARRLTDGALLWKTDLLPSLIPVTFAGVYDGATADHIVDDGQGNLTVLAAPTLLGGGDSGPGSGAYLVSLSASTGAVRWVQRLSADLYTLAGDEVGNLYASGNVASDAGYGQWEPRLFSWTPGGLERWQTPSAGWTMALSVASGRLVESESASTIRLTASGADLALPDAGFRTATNATEAVLDGVSGYQFFQPPYACCPDCSCPAMIPQLRLRSFTPASADVQWDVPVSPAPYPTSSPPLVSEALLTARGDVLYARSPNDIYAVTVHEERLEAVTPAGALRFSCELPGPGLFDAIAYTGPAALLTDRWVIAVQPVCYGCLRGPRPLIQAYDVPGYALATKGWVSQRGNGQRSGRPR